MAYHRGYTLFHYSHHSRLAFYYLGVPLLLSAIVGLLAIWLLNW